MTLLKVFVLRETRNLQALDQFLRLNWEQAVQDGKPLSVIVQPEKVKRNVAQNARYHAVLRDIAAQAWVEGRQFDQESWHELAKRKFIGLVDLPAGGVRGQSSANLSVGEFAAFMDQVEAWACTELGVEFLDHGVEGRSLKVRGDPP